MNSIKSLALGNQYTLENTFLQTLLVEAKALAEGQRIGDSRDSGQSHNYKAEWRTAWLNYSSCLAFGMLGQGAVNIDMSKKLNEAFCTQQAKQMLTLIKAKPSLSEAVSLLYFVHFLT